MEYNVYVIGIINNVSNIFGILYDSMLYVQTYSNTVYTHVYIYCNN